MPSQMRAVRAHGLGYAFFWSYALCIVLGDTGSAPTLINFAWLQQLAVVVAIALIGVCAGTRRDLPLTGATALASGFAMSLAGVAYALATTPGNPQGMPISAAGILLGVSNALQFLLWQKVYANEGQSLASVYLPLAAALGSLLSLLVQAAPPPLTTLYLTAVAPFATTACLSTCAAEMNPYTERPIDAALRAPMFSDLWRPALCSAITCLAWSFCKHFTNMEGAGSATVMAAGFCAASLIVLGLSLLTRREFGAPNVYRVMLPLVGVALFAPALLGPRGGYVLGTSLAFGAHLMTLLVSIIAASYAARTQLSPSLVFLVVMLPAQLAILAGDTAGTLLAPQGGTGGALMPAPAAYLIIALLVVTLVTSRNRGGRTLAEPVDDTLLINPPAAGTDAGCAGSAEELSGVEEPDSPARQVTTAYGLTAREGEVLNLLLKGNTMSAISRKLYISDNTTRGHMKRIYQKLDVHSRQELVDKVADEG